MSNGFGLSLSGQSHSQTPHHDDDEKEAIQANLYELGLLRAPRQRKTKKKKAVEFSSAVGQGNSTAPTLV